MADELNFFVEGSKGDTYQVTVIRDEKGNLTVTCNCTAGRFGKFCKHKWNVLRGEAELISDNFEDMETVNSWMFKSDHLREQFLTTAKAIKAVRKAEEEMIEQKKTFAKLIKKKK